MSQTAEAPINTSSFPLNSARQKTPFLRLPHIAEMLKSGEVAEDQSIPINPQPPSLGRRLIFWDFARASWQYDVVVGLILIFIFATPRDWFRDQPKPSSIILMSSQPGSNRVFIAADLLETVPEADRARRAQLLIHQRTGKSWHVAHVEPIRDEAAQEVKGFIAYTDQAQ